MPFQQSAGSLKNLNNLLTCHTRNLPTKHFPRHAYFLRDIYPDRQADSGPHTSCTIYGANGLSHRPALSLSYVRRPRITLVSSPIWAPIFCPDLPIWPGGLPRRESAGVRFPASVSLVREPVCNVPWPAQTFSRRAPSR